MNRISFSDSFNTLNARDAANFFSSIVCREFLHKTVFVGNTWEEEEKGNPLMKTVFIEFRVFNNGTGKKKDMTGTKYVWRSYRAKSFTCTNSSIRKVLES